MTSSQTVKSARRVLQILQYFNPERPEATVMDLARTLGFPQSSTTELLKALAQLGFLHYDRQRRIYRPTVQVALLGAWVQPFLFRQGHLLPMMDQISALTGQMVALGTQVALNVQYIHVIPSVSTMRMHIPQGTVRPLLRSALGKLLLSRESNNNIQKLVHRINAEAPTDQQVHPAVLTTEIDRIRQQGYALSTDVVTLGGGMVGVLLPQLEGSQTLSIGIGGLTSTIRDNCDEYVTILKNAIREHLELPLESRGDISPD
jgi:DNA-binding IclR family transcriptional regulator